MGSFHDKRIVVTGAGQGIGYGLCKGFAQEGAWVALNDADPALAQQAADEINRDLGTDRVSAHPADIADVSAVTALIDAFAEKHGGLDIVIANAGITRYMPFLESTPEVFDRVTGVNLRGTYFTAQAGAKRMIAAGIPGRVLLTSSITGMQAYPNFSIYGMTKAALQMLARSLALELGEHGITVNTITPGATLTERVLREDPNYETNWAKANVTGRVGYVEDVVAAALFLASTGARQITGHNLVVDGGWSIRSPLPEEIPTMPERQDYA